MDPNRIKKYCVRVCWYLILILIGSYVLVFLERGQEWENYYEFVLQGNEYILADRNTKNIKKPNIITFELSKLEATHGEILAGGSLSLSFYNDDKYCRQSADSNAKRNIALEIRNLKEKEEFQRIPAEVNCEKEYDDAGIFFSGFTDTVFVPVEGNVFDYPFDSLVFYFVLNIQPKIAFDKIYFYNRIHGIFFKTHPKITKKDSGLFIKFKTVRKNSIKIAYWIILFSIVLYIILIIFFVKKLGSLVSAVSGFFISVWSIRSLFSEGALVYPNLVDLTAIFSSIVLLIGILDRIIFRKYVKDE